MPEVRKTGLRTGRGGLGIRGQIGRTPALDKKKLRISDLVLECFWANRRIYNPLERDFLEARPPAIIGTSNLGGPES